MYLIEKNKFPRERSVCNKERGVHYDAYGLSAAQRRKSWLLSQGGQGSSTDDAVWFTNILLNHIYLKY